ncbi:TNF receptor-associated factor 3-like [Dysidea avara]|uniref:TNF receptor-associated factor 3-like n=1 Tax=Dysidea avara TaxID=196820 RepID=UPI00332DD533
MEKSDLVGGYSNKFVDNIVNEDYLCRICYLPSRCAQLSECCGHTFCNSCLNEMVTTSTNSSNCPVCRFEGFKTFSNKQIDRKIRSLKVYCSNEDKGCKWLGEVNDIQKHLDNNGGCEFEEVKCPKRCEMFIQRQHLADHIETDCPHRVVECEYCHVRGPHKFVTHEHKEICLKVPVDCPNHCDIENILREDLDEHRKVCSLEMVSCKYMKLGCGARIARKEEEEHRKEKMEEHL